MSAQVADIGKPCCGSTVESPAPQRQTVAKVAARFGLPWAGATPIRLYCNAADAGRLSRA